MQGTSSNKSRARSTTAAGRRSGLGDRHHSGEPAAPETHSSRRGRRWKRRPWGTAGRAARCRPARTAPRRNADTWARCSRGRRSCRLRRPNTCPGNLKGRGGGGGLRGTASHTGRKPCQADATPPSRARPPSRAARAGPHSSASAYRRPCETESRRACWGAGPGASRGLHARERTSAVRREGACQGPSSHALDRGHPGGPPTASGPGRSLDCAPRERAHCIRLGQGTHFKPAGDILPGLQNTQSLPALPGGQAGGRGKGGESGQNGFAPLRGQAHTMRGARARRTRTPMLGPQHRLQPGWRPLRTRSGLSTRIVLRQRSAAQAANGSEHQAHEQRCVRGRSPTAGHHHPAAAAPVRLLIRCCC
jgi:hypothetical protein